MSYRVLTANRNFISEYWDRTKHPLTLPRSLFIEAVSLAVVDVGMIMEYTQYQNNVNVWVTRAPDMMPKYNLLVDQGPIDPGPIHITVFNLSDKPVRIAKGEVIAWIMEL